MMSPHPLAPAGGCPARWGELRRVADPSRHPWLLGCGNGRNPGQESQLGHKPQICLTIPVGDSVPTAAPQPSTAKLHFPSLQAWARQQACTQPVPDLLGLCWLSKDTEYGRFQMPARAGHVLQETWM